MNSFLRNRRVILLLAFQIVLLVCLEVWLANKTGWLSDDAFISFRYAENWAEGHGPVFNPGERVEGYTNFLWVALLSIAIRAGLNPVSTAQAMGMLFSAATVATVFLFSLHLHRDKTRSLLLDLLPGSMLVVYFPFLAWSFGGLETHLFTFLLTLSALLWFDGRRLRLAVLFFGLCSLTRPEGPMYFAFGWLLLFIDSFRDSTKSLKESVTPALIFALVYIPYFLWRYSYYGYLFPNTFYAKVGFGTSQLSRGLEYVFRFIRHSGGLPLIAPLLWSLAIGKAEESKRSFFRYYLPLVCLVHLFYCIYTGGDTQLALRLAMPIMPVVCLLWADFLHRIILQEPVEKRHSWRIPLAFACSLLLSGFGYSLERMYPSVSRDKIWLFGRKIGEYFQEDADKDQTIATNTAGSIPFYSKTRAIDMLGLCDEHIAHREDLGLGKGVVGHEKYDGFYVLAQAPEYVIFGHSLATEHPVFPSDLELFYLEPFRRFYQRKSVTWDGYTFYVNELKDLDPDALHLSLANEYFEKGIYGQALEQYLMLPESRRDNQAIEQAREMVSRQVGRSFDFEEATYDGWQIEGDAFGEYPLKSPGPSQGMVVSWQGRYYANSFALGSDRHTGALYSLSFAIEGKTLSFLVGGSLDSGQCCVRLRNLETGEVAFLAAGQEDEQMRMVSWDVEHLKGKQVRIEIVDESCDSWGHIMADNFRQYR